jgi:uncharacterized integral membrane protein (TIGR00697 family)
MRKQHLMLLVVAHMLTICSSNILVQYPLVLLGWHTTWGAFSYPLIFILTDLTTRITGAATARKVIYMAMLPGLFSSFLIANWFEYGQLWLNNTLAMRIALASFAAYVSGQLVDILFFRKLQQQSRWWIAPTVANIFGNLLDTWCFFFIAFYHSSNLFMNAHWPEIATVDLAFKLVISLVSFVPLYGLIMAGFLRRQASGNTPEFA